MKHSIIDDWNRRDAASTRRSRRGLTLIECVFALVILSLAVTAIAYAVTAGQMQSAHAFRQFQAAMLAEALMDEVLSKTYSAPGNGTQLSRTSYGSAGQYNGFNETAGNLKTAAGVLYPTELQRFSRSVTVTSGSIALTGLGSAAQGLNITVTVSDPGGAVSALTRFMVKPS